MERKSVIEVMIIILIPILIMGTLAVTHAQSYEEQKDAENPSGENSTAAVEPVITVSDLISVPLSPAAIGPAHALV